MKMARSVRLSAETMKAVSWLQRHHGSDTSEAIRRLVRRGLEQEMSDLYRQGKLSLREMVEVLGAPLRECLDLLLRQGVTGNITMIQALEAADVVEDLSCDSHQDVPE